LTTASTVPVWIGGNPPNVNSTQQRWDGQIDEVRVYDRALSAPEILALTQGNESPVATGEAVTTNEGVAVAITLQASDPDGDALTYSVTTPPTHGSLSGTSPNLTYTPNAGFIGGDSFVFQVDDGNGGTDSATVSITVDATSVGLSITTQPSDQTVTEPASASFSVVATGDAPLSYQWRRNLVDLPGENNAVLTLATTSVAESGDQFTVVVSNAVDSVTSNVATLTVNAAPAAPTITPPDFKVAFIGDQGTDSNARALLQLILAEGADMVMHQGDLGYTDTVAAWDQMITDILGPAFPYFASIGNHDSVDWPQYQQVLSERLALVPGASCSGSLEGLGIQSSCTYQGLFFILSGVGTDPGPGPRTHDVYIRDELAQDNSTWSICSWHKNQQEMQVGGKTSETGWEVYEECRMGGAIVATGHEHSYSRDRRSRLARGW
jgi:hypothetical protein